MTQRVSHSLNADAIITLSTDNDFTSLNGSHADTLANKSFLVIGNDDGTATWNTVGAPSGFKILNRKWLVKNTGNVNGTYIAFDVDDADFDIPSLSSGNTYYLIVDTV